MEAQSTYEPGRYSGFSRRLATETKQAFKTTEFWAYIGVLIGLFIAGAVTDSSTAVTTGTSAGTTTSPDALPADKVWLYAVILTVGYLITRGLAKAGSRDPYWDQPSTSDGSSIGDRVKTAAQVLKDGDSDGSSQHEAGARH